MPSKYKIFLKLLDFLKNIHIFKLLNIFKIPTERDNMVPKWCMWATCPNPIKMVY